MYAVVVVVVVVVAQPRVTLLGFDLQRAEQRRRQRFQEGVVHGFGFDLRSNCSRRCCRRPEHDGVLRVNVLDRAGNVLPEGRPQKRVVPVRR